jgi:hypothetical protein
MQKRNSGHLTLFRRCLAQQFSLGFWNLPYDIVYLQGADRVWEASVGLPMTFALPNA